jgi:hypothetical protein
MARTPSGPVREAYKARRGMLPRHARMMDYVENRLQWPMVALSRSRLLACVSAELALLPHRSAAAGAIRARPSSLFDTPAAQEAVDVGASGYWLEPSGWACGVSGHWMHHATPWRLKQGNWYGPPSPRSSQPPLDWAALVVGGYAGRTSESHR